MEQELTLIRNILTNEVLESKTFDEEYRDEILYMRSKGNLMMFPYPFTEKYDQNSIEVHEYSNNPLLKYVIHNGKQLFYPAWNDGVIQENYNSLLLEQDYESPHRYMDEICNFKEGDIFVDVGAAEGIMSLDIVQKASKVYLYECSEKWIMALKETFKEYADKIQIINKFAGAVDNDYTITIDTLLQEYHDENIFIKMDIEGMELDALQGAVNTIKNNNCHLACATYHYNGQAFEIQQFLEPLDYKAYCSEGYMLFMYGKMALDNGRYERVSAPYFRKAMVRAVRNQ